ncbi:MAG: 16S rRNA (guanine(966)-N(2))-methyltransferase RsmD [Candidatus Omnitrophica bacterium]|nr:16S rRNA (guanine(966)-N(2))-methyltransferase RsmD [Candidatus Omnitrophota bacterium]
MPRITAGEWKGIELASPRQIRATEAKVRQALFNILGETVDDARVIDGFAGSGAIGFEALSRGAAFVAFIESDTDAVLCIRENLAKFEAQLPREAWRLLHLDVERGLRQLAMNEPPFDLIVLDPPYRTDEGKKALNAVVDCAILAPTGIVVVEHDQRTILPASIGPLHQCKRHRYGDTVLSLYQAGSAENVSQEGH